jgi:hypothetical protein
LFSEKELYNQIRNLPAETLTGTVPYNFNNLGRTDILMILILCF